MPRSALRTWLTVRDSTNLCRLPYKAAYFFVLIGYPPETLRFDYWSGWTAFPLKCQLLLKGKSWPELSKSLAFIRPDNFVYTRAV